LEGACGLTGRWWSGLVGGKFWIEIFVTEIELSVAEIYRNKVVDIIFLFGMVFIEGKIL